MKEIKAIFRPNHLQAVLRSLDGIDGVHGVSLVGVDSRHVVCPSIDAAWKVRLEALVEDRHVDAVVNAVHRHAYLNADSDGCIVVCEVSMAVMFSQGREAYRHSGSPVI